MHPATVTSRDVSNAIPGSVLLRASRLTRAVLCVEVTILELATDTRLRKLLCK
jgi:hypothetical protein